MMEHIFRNINDIRVFDAISEFNEKDTAIYLDDIMEIIYGQLSPERIQIEDSIRHLTEQQIIGIVLSPEEISSGCKTCKETDDKKLPRKKGHKDHKPIEYRIENIEKYYLLSNDLTKFLVSAVFESSFMFADKYNKTLKSPDN